MGKKRSYCKTGQKLFADAEVMMFIMFVQTEIVKIANKGWAVEFRLFSSVYLFYIRQQLKLYLLYFWSDTTAKRNSII